MPTVNVKGEGRRVKVNVKAMLKAQVPGAFKQFDQLSEARDAALLAAVLCGGETGEHLRLATCEVERPRPHAALRSAPPASSTRPCCRCRDAPKGAQDRQAQGAARGGLFVADHHHQHGGAFDARTVAAAPPGAAPSAA